MKSNFPANSVISTYITTENMLVDVLRVIPYCDAHESVWSPVLVTILLETCSQLDSLWKYEAKQSAFVTKGKLDVRDYFSYFGEYMAPKWVVFYGEEPRRLQPFDTWGNVASYNPSDYPGLDWWTAYNNVKHDRLKNRPEATLRHSTNALAGLFVAILRFELCRTAIAQAGWLLGDGHNLQAWLWEDSPSTKSQHITAESKLFTYPIGWSKEKITRTAKWDGTCSLRFRDWFDQRTS